MNKKVLVIGAGLAGSEAAYFLARHGINVVLAESKGIQRNPAQKLNTAAELVCTNSLKSMKPETAHGMLKFEMRELDSVVLKIGETCSVPAGDALAVDRVKFSEAIQNLLSQHENIELVSQDVSDPIELAQKYNCEFTIVATGPLTTPGLEKWIQESLSEDDFFFYDAIAPVVDADSLNMERLYFKDRHKEVAGEDSADYLNIPLNEQEYYAFIQDLKEAEKVKPKNFEKEKFFESCLPIDVMAERGDETARFSCMKPIGLEMPNGEIPFAAVQLRKENLLGSAYNMVGFQTRLTYPEQKRVFSQLPGFENVQFLHLGSVHRNSFLHAKKLLNFDMSSKKFPQVHFAGQITGVEGYTESASSGLYVAWQILRKLNGEEVIEWPKETAIGALVNYVMTVDRPAPSNINAGLLPNVTLTKEQRRNRKERKRIKKTLISQRAQSSFRMFKEQNF